MDAGRRDAARANIKAAGQLQLGVAGMTAFSFLVTFIKLALWHPDPNLPTEITIEIVRWRGPVLWGTLAGGGALTIVTALWAWLNWRGLKEMKSWARVSSIAFAGMTIAMCCLGPFGGFVLYLLLRNDVKAVFDENRAGKL